MPSARARSTVSRCSSAGAPVSAPPVLPQPKPISDTSRPVFPNARYRTPLTPQRVRSTVALKELQHAFDSLIDIPEVRVTRVRPKWARGMLPTADVVESVDARAHAKVVRVVVDDEQRQLGGDELR